MTTGAVGRATLPASRSAATMSAAKKNELTPATTSKVSSGYGRNCRSPTWSSASGTRAWASSINVADASSPADERPPVGGRAQEDARAAPDLQDTLAIADAQTVDRRFVRRELLLLGRRPLLRPAGRTGAGAHDLLRLARRGRILDWAGESQYYAEPKRLTRLGYLEARREPGKTRERTVYALTDRGPEALRTHAATPAAFTRLKSEPLLRLLIADLVGERATVESLTALSEEIADLHDRVDESEAAARDLPHRSTYLLIVTRFLRRYLDLHSDLIDEVERELASGRRSPPGATTPG